MCSIYKKRLGELLNDNGKLHTFECDKCIIAKIQFICEYEQRNSSVIDEIKNILQELIISEAYRSVVLALYTMFSIFDDIYPILSSLRDFDYPDRVYHIIRELIWYYMAKKEYELACSLMYQLNLLIGTLKSKQKYTIPNYSHINRHIPSHFDEHIDYPSYTDNKYEQEEWNDDFLYEPIEDNDVPLNFDFNINEKMEEDAALYNFDIDEKMEEDAALYNFDIDEKMEEGAALDNFDINEKMEEGAALDNFDIDEKMEETAALDINERIEEDVPQPYYGYDMDDELTPEEIAFIFS